MKNSTIYFLPIVAGEWCGYRSKEEWKAHASKVVWPLMGYFEKTSAGVQVNLRQQDSTSDWLVDDKYTLDSTGQITELRRTIFYFSDDERKETTYLIQGGRAIVTQNKAFSLKTSAPLKLPLPMDEYESWKIYTRTADFPFSQLLKESIKVPSTGPYCTKETTP